MRLWPLSHYDPSKLPMDPEKAALHAQIASLEADVKRERDRFDALLEKFTALRVAGAVPEPKEREWDGLVAPPKHDELRDLIHERFAGNTRALGKALTQLARDRADKVDEEKIRASILNGYSPEGVPA